jgi:hypothetical protein
MIEIRFGFALSLLIVVHFLFGVSHIALLPPWEGFDEPAHYSSIQQIVDTGSIPRLGRAWLSVDVEEYRHHAPSPYPLHGSRGRPHDITYTDFFAGGPMSYQAGFKAVHEAPPQSRRFEPSSEANWQAQHPPLFYLLMAPVQRLTNDWSWGAQLFLLRLVSYLPAVTALALLGFALAPAVGAKFALTAVAVWPVLFPTWFPEMARLGNDGLCALFVGCLWLVLNGRTEPARLPIRYVAVGAILGAGLLTKGYFVPISIGVLAYLLVRDRSPWVLFAAGIAFAMGSWWYAWNWFDLGNPTGFVEFRLQGVGEESVLLQFVRNITWEHAILAPAGFVRSFAWSGTWSFALPGTAMQVGIAVIPILVAVFYVAHLWSNKNSRSALQPEFVPMWVVAPVLLGFVAHFVIKVAEGALVVAPTPGWYMHVLVVPLGVGLAFAVRAFWRHPWFRVVATCCLAFAAYFSAFVAWQQVLLFAGFVGRAAGRASYAAIGEPPSIFEIDVVLARLESLTFPWWGAAFFTLALAGLAVAVILTFARPPSRPVA